MVFGLPTWLTVSLVLLAVLVFLLRTTNQVYLISLLKQNLFYMIMLAIFIFFAISLTYIHTHYEMDFTTLDGIKGALKIYFSWLSNIARNIGKVTGYAAQLDWIRVDNSTIK
ncbi:hypothetical protein D6817_04290 [Candidatus Pacearchaeota archaeon]|nr:MAG: hypothetical protein D6817_04290 [Candidatus Pacearchaeota archaeon]